MDTGTTRMNRFIRHPIRATLALAIIACLPTSPVMAQSAPAPATDARANFAIAAGDLAGALDQFSTQTGIQFVYAPGLTAGKQVEALSGQLTWQAALERLLRGSGLVYEEVGTKMVVIRKGPDDRAKPGTRPAAAATSSTAETPPIADMQAVTVTGTRIRGGATPSPVIAIGAEDIRQEGFTDLGEVIRSVTQNFRGGQNPGAIDSSAILGIYENSNVNGGSALNLRGLGPDATLTLLNGRRLSYGGFVQAIDISAIPVAAVERLEIVPDGASAIYGSDAVAGVGNVILKRDFDGVEVGTRYSGATQGGLTTRSYDVTAGTTWSGGGVIATYLDSSADPLRSDQRSYTRYMYSPYTIYPELRQRSGLLSAHQSVGGSVELRLDALRTKRNQLLQAGYGVLYYDMTSKTSTSFISPEAAFNFDSGWTVSLGGTSGNDRIDYTDTVVTIPSGAIAQALSSCYCNKSRTYEIGAEGPLFALGGGDARLALGAGLRRNSFQNRSYSRSTVVGGDEDSRFAYAEVSLPFIDSTANLGGVQRLELTAALRSEDYDSFGKVTTPKLGLIYGPNPDFTLRASWGKSFKAPTLYQRYGSRQVYLSPAKNYGGSRFGPDATVLGTLGGNPDLGPERAETWSASLAFHPREISGLEAELTFFNIDYAGRVVTPIRNSPQALSNPVYGEFVGYAPSPELQAEILDTHLFYNNTGSNLGRDEYDRDDVAAVFYNNYVNAARQKIRGIDLSGAYRFDVADGHLKIRGSASWLDSRQRTTSLQEEYDLAGTIYNPARINSRVGAIWNRRGLTASLFANYTGGVTNTWTTAGASEKIASMTTFDAVLRYAAGSDSHGLPIWDFALSAQNLFDRDPPFYTIDAVFQLPYDATNYSPIGRFLNVSVSRRW